MLTYEVDDVSEDMSFLEMLDVLNERLIAEGEDPIAFDHDCREGICGMCGLMINGEAHGPRGHHHLPAAHAVLQGRRRRSPSSRGAPTPSRSSRTWSSTAAPSTGSSRPAATSRSTPAPPPRRTPSRCPRTTRTAPSTWPPASAAAPASRPAPTARPRCSSAPRSPTSASCRRASPSATPAWSTWSPQHDHEGFGGCTNIGECTAACPKEIPLDVISQLNKDLRTAMRHGH